MIALLQRVSEAAVHVEDMVPSAATPQTHLVGRIGHGMLALIGVEQGDGEEQAQRLVQRMLAWRMFDDRQGKMNLDLAQSGGGLLLVPQFTLAADTNSGNRPSFSSAAPPAEAKRLFDSVVESARRVHRAVETGRFGANMKVSLVNTGPVTFWLQVRPTT
ncbi:MAG: D-tyrosyl-tRNA(Tyr) deacylase [Xanthomonadales bacterium]|nr:D-tyrosyl-tRNA(Tyr) deacylase [Xanthomonadales bacterium]